MKNLANCKPSEFLIQTNKIRKSVGKWLTDTDIANIRKRMPKLPDDVTDEERKQALDKQATENFNAILDSILDEHPTETLELLALLCFVDPDKVDDYSVPEYLESYNEMIGNEAVMGFFISLVNWVNQLT